jgi:mRNA-degrading endonuclease YafQ of YafQ-DinJ toxin-antitoxin module
MVQAWPWFGPGVMVTRDFVSCWSRLHSHKQEIVRQKIALLIKSPHHPSLRVHQLYRAGRRIWNCSLSRTERLIYTRHQRGWTLHFIGSHRIIDTVHIRHFSK